MCAHLFWLFSNLFIHSQLFIWNGCQFHMRYAYPFHHLSLDHQNRICTAHIMTILLPNQRSMQSSQATFHTRNIKFFWWIFWHSPQNKWKLYFVNAIISMNFAMASFLWLLTIIFFLWSSYMNSFTYQYLMWCSFCNRCHISYLMLPKKTTFYWKQSPSAQMIAFRKTKRPEHILNAVQLTYKISTIQ